MFFLVTLTSHSLIKEKGNGANKQATFLAGFVPEVAENVDVKSQKVENSTSFIFFFYAFPLLYCN